AGKKALDTARQRARLIIMTGGLGPTRDDVTKAALCEYFNTQPVMNEEVLRWVEKIFSDRNLPMLEMNRLQAMVPQSCKVLFNRNGTAPGMWFDQDDTVFISIPGVPFEMKML